MFGSFGQPVHDNNGSRRAHGVNDSNEGFLRHFAFDSFGESEDSGPHERESHGKNIGALPMKFKPKKESNGGSQRRHLGEREIDKNNPSLHHVKSQVSVNAGENQTGIHAYLGLHVVE